MQQPIEKAWLFGSYSCNEEKRYNDIDIMIRFDGKEEITLLKYAGMIASLKKLLRKEIDLVEEGELKDFAQKNVDRDKILIYEREAKG
jgi:predicted nucleotidyltransferase